jgi:photosystem II stability/assembly factor-like uncharacterized protein
MTTLNGSMDGLFRVTVLLAGFLASAIPARAAPPCWLRDGAASGRTVWLLCQDGKILRSDDQGAKWQQQSLPSQVNLYAIAFLDARRGYVAGDNGTLLATEDGGANWKAVTLPTQERLTTIIFVGELGWVAGGGGVILHSSDGGRNWGAQASGVSQAIEELYFLDAQRGWAAGWIGTILRTTDGGRTWEQVRSSAILWSLSAIYFRDAKNGWAVGFAGQIVRSRDGGVSWEAQTSPVKSWLTSVAFDGSNRGWVAGDDALLMSADGGETWKPARVNELLFLIKLLPVSGSLWAIGQFGVLKQSGPDPTWKELEAFGARAPATEARPSVNDKTS